MVIEKVTRDEKFVIELIKHFNDKAKELNVKWKINYEVENVLILQKGSELLFLKFKLKTMNGVKVYDSYKIELSDENFKEIKPILETLEEKIEVVII